MKPEFFRFLVSAGSATSAHYLTFWLCLSVIGVSATVSSALGYLVGSVVSYLMSYYYVFNSKRSHGKALLLFYLMVATGFFINTGIVHALAAGLDWNHWLSQICATAMTLLWNFLVLKGFVYRLGSCMDTAMTGLESVHMTLGRPPALELRAEPGAPAHVLNRFSTGRNKVGDNYPVEMLVVDWNATTSGGQPMLVMDSQCRIRAFK